jgi:hypothetical protein
MKERMVLKHRPFYDEERKPDLVVEAEYVPVEGAYRTTYDVVVEGEIVGRITRATESTDRHYGRIGVPGKGRPAWSWNSRKDGRNNIPGLYAHNRRTAVAEIMGYTSGEREQR